MTTPPPDELDAGPASAGWLRLLAAPTGLVAAGTLIGHFLGSAAPGAAAALAGLLLWHLHRLRHMIATLQGDDTTALPTRGVLGALALTMSARLREQHQRALRHQQALAGFRRAASDFPYPLILVDADSLHVRWFNRAATRLIGLRRPEDLGHPLRVLLDHPEAGPWLRAGCTEPLALESPADPATRLQLRLVPFSAHQNLLAGEDITQLTRLEQVRRDFVANVSHELRTPLTVIHGYLDLLSPEDSPELAPILPEMRSQSQRMTRIVEDLLTISRLEAQQELVEERVAIAPMLHSLQREAMVLSRGQHEVSVEDALTLDLAGSPADLHSAFSNLVSNAVRYTPAGGRITIRFERHGDGARLAVSDTGHGIPASHIPRLAERFYRVSASRSRELGGTGLGLSIVKHVLHLHQARLTIESMVGRGSTFACAFGAARLLQRLPAECTDEPN